MESQHRTFARESIKRHEGFREKAYYDTVGVLTIGYGTNLVELANTNPDMLLRIAREGFDITEPLAATLMHDLFEDSVLTAERFAGDVWNELTERQRAVLIDMAYNLGATRLATFKNMRKHLRALEFNDVADHMLASKWAQQVGKRAVQLAKWMQEG